MFNQYSPDEDARVNEHDATEVRGILRRRRTTINPTVCSAIAGGLAAVTLLVSGFIYADVQHNPTELLTKQYAAFLAFALALAFAAAAAAFTWMIVRDARRRAADEDVIRQYHQQQQVDAIRDAIAVFLREGDASALKLMERTQEFLGAGTGTEMGRVHHLRHRG
ncbi:hypothetical protein JNW88_23485 [Micromonospora sp. ATA32]|nr:hypothetical protein [Micromonospora sp. ATA32]